MDLREEIARTIYEHNWPMLWHTVSENYKEPFRATAAVILALLKQAGYVRLSEDQSLPELSKLGSWSRLWQDGYEMCQQDMLKAGFKKIADDKEGRSQ